MIRPAMKPVLCLVPLAVLFTACDSNDEKESAAGTPPKAVVVVEEKTAAAPEEDAAPAPRAILISEPDAEDIAEVSAPRAILVSEVDEEAAVLGKPASGRVIDEAGDKIEESAKGAEAP